MSKFALAKLLTLKAGTAVLAVTATGGVALAAATGTLPTPLTEAGATPSAHATGKPSEAADQGKGPAGAKGDPSPNLVGLCHAFTAGAGDNPGKALENPAFRVLITTAGDREKVAAYCETLLAAEKVRPSQAARPTATPSHPTGKPGARPTSAGSTRTHAPDAGHKPTARPAS
ncbi:MULTISPECIES: hypothetical protein [Micromonospora]|uniref:Uncharacterized protein n=1 Tax=Micromonospora solifontis TaxID=2487138 RepID=A0ABX9WDQ3_9ACTN|nr:MULTISPECIES: hypothetical protein [Micromonospora]NES16824.1 hypothetical protein [Micromonospora sp. PPF5-17B]NES37842.1 hypothetical protein [Micromonospora solifontis]NES58538.1 hypothetical protein [Micromonospora sp. PPF5-6]RNL97937.1 hypothetical protein EFE23_17045 [Micromonospora solifontis]